jgi:3-hydroxyisobutyrate dehydrogenase-like beta-hydroxyacid dehydrogenase
MRLDNLFDDAHPGWFTPAPARKDLRLGVGLAEQAGVDVRVGPATDELLSAVIDAGSSWPDFSAASEVLNRH